MEPEVLHTLAPTISPLQLPTSPPTIQVLRGVSDSPFREQASAFGDVSAFEPTMPPRQQPLPTLAPLSVHKLQLIFKRYLRLHLLGKAFPSSPGKESFPILCPKALL